MAIAEINTCPRKAFLHTAVDSGIIKASILRGIMKDVLLSSPLTITEKALKKKVQDAFDAKANKLLGFESEAECDRMNILLWRYLCFGREFRQQGQCDGRGSLRFRPPAH